MNDLATVRRFISGSHEAFEELVLVHKDRLIFFLLKYTGGDFHLAEDAAQEAFAAIYVHREQFDFRSSFKTWLFTVARNTAVDMMRQRSRLQTCSLDESLVDPFGFDAELEEAICRSEEQRHIHRQIGQLKPAYQQAICLVDLEGLTYADAARIMGKTLVQFRVLMHRARAALRGSFAKEMIS
jgi:RNA polymerase sigma-70 factor (ECF subfamily)